MRNKSEKVLLEVQKIWFRVMSIYYRSGNRAVKIPSSNELAREFGIAPTTVRLAFKKLEKEGYLVMRKGSGTYTNPVRFSQFGVNGRKPLIGLLLQTGDLFFYQPSTLRYISAATEILAQMNWNVRLITERCVSPEETEEVLHHSYLDGLICVSVEPGVAEKAAEILPTINLNYEVEGVPCVYSAYRPVLEKLRELYGARKHIEVDLCCGVPERYPLRRELAAMPGVVCRNWQERWSGSGDDRKLQKELSENVPDWIIVESERFEKVRSILLGLYGEERTKSILWIFWNSWCPDTGWNGVSIETDDRIRMRLAVKMLAQQLSDPAATVQSEEQQLQLFRLPSHEQLY